MAIFITGDTHGDFRRFGASIFYEQKELTKDDYVVVCGDFGIWDDGPDERHWLKWLDGKPFTTLFVSGNHENYELDHADASLIGISLTRKRISSKAKSSLQKGTIFGTIIP